MAKDLQKSIQQLRELSPKLNAACDDASRTVGLVEAFLNEECGIGLPAEAFAFEEPVSADGDDKQMPPHSSTIRTSLIYARVGREYRLAVKTQLHRASHDGAWNMDQPVDIQLWANLGREAKLATFGQLPALIELIVDKATEALDATRGAGIAVTRILDAFKK